MGARPQIWTTREGERIPVQKMADSHLSNAIAYLERRGERYKQDIANTRTTLYSDQYLQARARHTTTLKALKMLKAEAVRRADAAVVKARAEYTFLLEFEGPGFGRTV